MPRKKNARRVVKKVSGRRKRLYFAYPLIIFILICVGIYLVAWTLKASGDSVTVFAKVPGPPVTAPPAITNIVDNQQFDSTPIYVSGTCPSNAAYIEVFDNSIMQGSAICQNNFFDPQFNLYPGENQITAQAFNVTDDPGPVSLLTIVYYNPPVPPQALQPSSQPSSVAPLTLKTAFVYKGYYVGQQVQWPLEISGGTAPYAVEVDWGDGQTNLISRSDGSQFNITHTYKKPGGYNGSYTIKVEATDAAGTHAYIQFFVIVKAPNATNNLEANIFSKPPPSLGSSVKWLIVAWPAYILVGFMALSYWLGEREELIILKKRGRLRR